MLDLCLDADAVRPLHPTRTHPKTGEPLRAVGLRRNGSPIWPILGASPDDPDDGDKDDADDSDDDGDGDDADDDGDGDDQDDDDKDSDKEDKNSVEYWKKRSRQNEREAKRKSRELDRLKGDKKTPKSKGKKSDDDGDADPEQIREQAREEARQEVLRDRVSDKIEAKARKFADPEDAAVMLLRSSDVDDFLDDDGKVDIEAINEALDELLEKKPYLSAEKPKRFQGDGDGGGRPPKKARPKSIGEAVSKKYKT